MKKRLSLIAISLLLALLLAALQMASNAIQNPQDSSNAQYYTLLLQVAAVGLFFLLLIIAGNIFQLMLRWYRKEPGAKLTAKVVGLFLVLAVIPVVIVFSYSVQFLYKGIDNWFDTQIESALIDSLELSRTALRIREKIHLEQTQKMLVNINQGSDELIAVRLDKLREANQADELTLMTQTGEIVVTSSISSSFIPEAVTQTMRLAVQTNGYLTLLEPLKGGDLSLRVIVTEQVNQPYLLQSIFAIPKRLIDLGDSVEAAYEKHGRISYMRKYIKSNFVMTLSLVLLFSVFSAILVAFIFTRRLMEPIRDLAKGTKAIAEGDYEQKIQLQRNDDLGFLVKSFNVMSEKISQARDLAEKSQKVVEDQRLYLESILGGLSSGVMTFDQHQQLITVNVAAHDILQVEKGQVAISTDNLRLNTFFGTVMETFKNSASEWRAEVNLPDTRGKQILLCHGTELKSADGEKTGNVLLFDDVTQLVQAQRDAAWGEVARRLAHEIKNPLTPIQLSAERLRHKYLRTMEEKEAKVLDKATSTIIAQVDTMKTMVNAFAEYAKKPEMKKAPLNANALMMEVADLYQHQNSAITVKKQLAESLPDINADSHQLRQVMNNLMKNAFEAIEDLAQGEITVSSAYFAGDPCIQLAIEDNGAGFAEEVLGHVFEPYKTTKLKGTGLGLAIVKKIVEEHGGDIHAENAPQGARVVLHLPVIET